MRVKSLVAMGILLVLSIFIVYEIIQMNQENEMNDLEEQMMITNELLDENDQGFKEGERAPGFTLNDLQGNKVSLEDFRGKKVILNFWASWCGPCRDEMPDMQEFYEEKKDQNIEVVAVNLTHFERNRDEIEQFVSEFDLTFPIPLDEGGHQKEVYQVINIPTSYFLDEEGIIKHVYRGPMTKAYMEDKINEMSDS